MIYPDFGCATKFEDGEMLLERRREVPFGNQSHICPEGLNGVGQGQAVSMKKQAVFALGVLGFEVMTGDHPVLDYPVSCGPTGSVTYARADMVEVSTLGLGYDSRLTDLLYKMVDFDPDLRPTLEEALDVIQSLW